MQGARVVAPSPAAIARGLITSEAGRGAGSAEARIRFKVSDVDPAWPSASTAPPAFGVENSCRMRSSSRTPLEVMLEAYAAAINPDRRARPVRAAFPRRCGEVFSRHAGEHDGRALGSGCRAKRASRQRGNAPRARHSRLRMSLHDRPARAHAAGGSPTYDSGMVNPRGVLTRARSGLRTQFARVDGPLRRSIPFALSAGPKEMPATSRRTRPELVVWEQSRRPGWATSRASW